MPTAAPYDEIADWYESVFLARQRSNSSGEYADALGIDQALVEVLGPGQGRLLEVGCGICGPVRCRGARFTRERGSAGGFADRAGPEAVVIRSG